MLVQLGIFLDAVTDQAEHNFGDKVSCSGDRTLFSHCGSRGSKEGFNIFTIEESIALLRVHTKEFTIHGIFSFFVFGSDFLGGLLSRLGVLFFFFGFKLVLEFANLVIQLFLSLFVLGFFGLVASDLGLDRSLLFLSRHLGDRRFKIGLSFLKVGLLIGQGFQLGLLQIDLPFQH